MSQNINRWCVSQRGTFLNRNDTDSLLCVLRIASARIAQMSITLVRERGGSGEPHPHHMNTPTSHRHTDITQICQTHLNHTDTPTLHRYTHITQIYTHHTDTTTSHRYTHITQIHPHHTDTPTSYRHTHTLTCIL